MSHDVYFSTNVNQQNLTLVCSQSTSVFFITFTKKFGAHIWVYAYIIKKYAKKT